MTPRYKYLDGFTFHDCHVRTREIIGFTAQKWPHSDPLEVRETAVFFYYPNDPPKSRWAYIGIGDTTGIHGCAAFKPAERWVFVTDDGEVYVSGKGTKGWEKPVATSPLRVSNLKSVRGGHAICVGPNRRVYKRTKANGWTVLDAGLSTKGADFVDIDGFNEKDMYACGNRGELWHYDGKVWKPVNVPTTADFEAICCASDGQVYILTAEGQILRGRNASWTTVASDFTDEILEAIVEYDDKILVSTVEELYYLEDDKLEIFAPDKPKMNSYAHLAAGDRILVVAGDDEAILYDGTSWSVIVQSPRSCRQSG